MSILIHFLEKKLATIQELHKLHVVCFMFKVDKFLCFHTFQMFLYAGVYSYNTRFTTNYRITVNQTSLLHHTIRIVGPLLWNSLDSNIKSVTSLNTFRRKFKNLLLGQVDS